MLKLSNQTDELLDEFHSKIPYIDEVLHEWAEMKGASPTVKGLEQLQAQSSYQSIHCQGNEDDESENGGDYIFNMVSAPNSPVFADTIYLTDALEYADADVNAASDIPSNIRGDEWPNFDGCYTDVESDFEEFGPSSAIPQALKFSKTKIEDCPPPNLRTYDWGTHQNSIRTAKAYTPSNTSDVLPNRRESGPFEKFWRNHGAPYGPQMVLNDEDDTDSISPSSSPRCASYPDSPDSLHSFPGQDPAHLMVPTWSP